MVRELRSGDKDVYRYTDGRTDEYDILDIVVSSDNDRLHKSPLQEGLGRNKEISLLQKTIKDKRRNIHDHNDMIHLKFQNYFKYQYVEESRPEDEEKVMFSKSEKLFSRVLDIIENNTTVVNCLDLTDEQLTEDMIDRLLTFMKSKPFVQVRLDVNTIKYRTKKKPYVKIDGKSCYQVPFEEKLQELAEALGQELKTHSEETDQTVVPENKDEPEVLQEATIVKEEIPEAIIVKGWTSRMVAFFRSISSFVLRCIRGKSSIQTNQTQKPNTRIPDYGRMKGTRNFIRSLPTKFLSGKKPKPANKMRVW